MNVKDEKKLKALFAHALWQLFPQYNVIPNVFRDVITDL